MKKFLFILGLIPFLGTSQIFFENFDASTSLPTGWVSFIGTNGAGTNFNWTTSTARAFSPSNSAFVRYENSGQLNEDWLVTPQINLTGVTGTTLSFYGGQQYTTVYNSTYIIKVSTASQTTHADFTDIEFYSETDFSGAVDGPVLLPTDLKTIDLSAYDGQQIYIAFVMLNDDGDNFFVDDVTVTGTLSTQSNQIEGFIHAFDSQSQTLLLKANNNLDEVLVYNALGQNTMSKKLNESSASIDFSSMANGVYVVKVFTNNQMETFKMIKK